MRLGRRAPLEVARGLSTFLKSTRLGEARAVAATENLIATLLADEKVGDEFLQLLGKRYPAACAIVLDRLRRKPRKLHVQIHRVAFVITIPETIHAPTWMHERRARISYSEHFLRMRNEGALVLLGANVLEEAQ